jgi:hypothetical protein
MNEVISTDNLNLAFRLGHAAGHVITVPLELLPAYLKVFRLKPAGKRDDIMIVKKEDDNGHPTGQE